MQTRTPAAVAIAALLLVAPAGAGEAAPSLTGYDLHSNKICGFPNASLRRTLQARNAAEVLYHLRFDGRTQPILLPDDLARIRVQARGAGVDVDRRPDARVFSRYREAGLRIRATRAGHVRFSATVDGVRAGSRRIRVLPPRHECGT
jgi:hypothetical protein